MGKSPAPYVFLGRVGVWDLKGPSYVFLGIGKARRKEFRLGLSPKRETALRAAPGLVPARLAAMMVVWSVK